MEILSRLGMPRDRGVRPLLAIVAAVMIALAAPRAAEAREPGVSFAPLVERVSPAVVNIRTVQVVSARELAEQAEQDNPNFPPGSPLDEFFRRFVKPQMPRGPREVVALGSGFIVDPSGIVVTNSHVVGRARKVTVTLPTGEEFEARLLGQDEKTDLAVLKIASDRPLPSVPWADSDRVKVGDWVLAIGNPFGLGGTVTAGIVSARGRDIGSGPFDDFIQVDAPINRGNSGGPSFDVDGAVVGVNTAIFSPSGGSVGIGFAIPAKIARQVVAQLQSDGRIDRGWLGVQAQPLDPTLAEALRLAPTQKGVVVAAVEPGSPANAAGIRQGDVLTMIDRVAIEHPRELPRLIAERKPGDRISVTALRAGTATALPLTIGAAPRANDDPGATATGADPALTIGIKLTAMSQALRKRLGIPTELQGVLVTDVAEGSHAQARGLQAGDIIVALDDRPVTKATEVFGALYAAQREGRGAVALLTTRGGVEQYIALDLRGRRIDKS